MPIPTPTSTPTAGADPDPDHSPGAALPHATLPLLLLGAFLALGLAVAPYPPGRFDRWAEQALMDHGSARLTRVMRLITDLGSDRIAVPVMIAIIGWLVWRHAGRVAVITGAVWAAAKLSSGITKVLFDRERPLPSRLLGLGDQYSFPSGHTVTAVITYGLIAALLVRHRHGPDRWLPVVLAIIIALAVAVSRVYLGRHYATDVIGGLLLGAAWLSIGWLWLGGAGPAPASAETAPEPG